MTQFEDLLVSDIYFVICTTEGSSHEPTYLISEGK